MKSRTRIAGFIAWAVILSATAGKAAPGYTVAENPVLLGGIQDVAAVDQAAQTFTALQGGKLATISVNLSHNGPVLPAQVLVDIRRISGGLPGPVLATASMPTGSIGTASGVSYVETADFSSFNVVLSAGSLYAFSLRAPDGDPGHAYVSGSGDVYADGAAYYSLDSGHSWLQQTGYDLTFTVSATTNVIPASSPIITCPNPLTLECTNGSAVGTVQAGVMDTNGLPLEVVWTVDGIAYQTNDIPSGGTVTASNVTFAANFGDGEHTVVVSASNGLSAPATCSTTVTVSDTLPPTVLSISATPDLIWPPNHRLVPVTVNVTAADNCDSSLTAQITKVTCNEEPGRFAPDIEITGPLSVNLRAERLGNDSRIYTIYVDVSDSSGNVTTVTTTVTVPKSLSLLH